MVLNVSIISEANSDTTLDVVISLQIDNSIMKVNGEDCEIDAGRGTTPLVVKGRTLVPLRAIIENFGGTVEWENSTKTVILEMNNEIIRLSIDNQTAYYNDEAYTLDVAPAIINERTMLPIRFVAERFNIGVAWDGASKTVYLIRNGFDDEEYVNLRALLPAFNGEPYAEINNNKPFFAEYEIIDAAFEYYSNLDEFGRCDVCMASVAVGTMPTGEKGNISSIKPTGWHNSEYEIVDGGYLYNRCHLIGYQLTGENANERNLITGTRYMNVDGMLKFENIIDDYVDKTGNNVMYRVTPVFSGENMVADGVLLEAYSIKDRGEGVSFCVFCYNVQPGIDIDYVTGNNKISGDTPVEEVKAGVYRTKSGKRYHFDAECGGKNSFETTLDEAKAAGLTPCQKCAV